MAVGSISDSDLLQIAGKWLQALTDGSKEVVALVDSDGAIQFMSVSGAVQQMLGYDALELASKSHGELLHPEDTHRVVSAFRSVASEHGARHTSEYRVRHRSGHYIRVQSTAVNRLLDEVVGAIVVHTREISIPEIPLATGIDPVTHLHDRKAFIEVVNEAVDRARTDHGYGFSVLIVELDRLKMLVGSYGQDVVDELLAEVGRRLGTLVGRDDTLAQLGGGEFAIMLEGIGDRRNAARTADLIQTTIGKGYEVDGHKLATDAIVGIATSERQYDRAEHVLRDAALAANRARGKSRRRRAVFQTQMRVEDTRYMSLVAELHNALQGNQLRLHYQPIISLATRTLCGFEALVRWQHPEQGMISPGMFIPVAEETGLIVPIGQWVLREACRQMAEWHNEFRVDPPLHVSVNLSAKQFVEENLMREVEQTLSETGLDGRQLKLEITETAVLENREAAADVLNALKAQGVRVSLDDFGTGYSSFSYLHQLPYDTLKIDRSFVSRIGDGGENSEIIHAIIVLAHNLRMDVVAEGVETAGQAAQLKNMWCEYAQGYFFARPMDAVACRALIGSQPQW